jgi:hypothetical protein
MPEYKRTYRKGYLVDCRVRENKIEFLIGIPYPNDKWFNYIENRTGAVESLMREFGLYVTRNPLIDCHNLKNYLDRYDYTVLRLSKPKNQKQNSYFSVFVGHDSIKNYPIMPDCITWNPKQKAAEITKEDAMMFLKTSLLKPILDKIKGVSSWEDIPNNYNIVSCVFNNQSEWDMYSPILKTAFDGIPIAPELYLINKMGVPDYILEQHREYIQTKISGKQKNEIDLTDSLEMMENLASLGMND